MTPPTATKFIGIYLIFFFLSFTTINSTFTKPIRLLTTFVHEFSHAIACWLTGGSVYGIEVYSNAGGLTKYVGGCRCIIASAGYLGESFWGMIFVVSSGGRKTSTVSSCALVLSLLIALCYRANRTMWIINLFYVILTSAFVYMEWFVEQCEFILLYVTLFYGVFFGTYAIIDIHSGQVLRSPQGSDAYSLYEESNYCCLPKLIGIVWLVVAIILQLLGLWISLILMSAECENVGWFECLFHTNVGMKRLFQRLQDLW